MTRCCLICHAIMMKNLVGGVKNEQVRRRNKINRGKVGNGKDNIIPLNHRNGTER